MARMLLIDDEPDLLELGALGLQAAGHTVETLSEASKVVDVTRRFQPDVIGLDWVIPPLDGEAILRQLKANEDTRPIPVVVVTALSGIERHVRLLGAAAVLHKPFTVADLNATLAKVVAHDRRRV